MKLFIENFTKDKSLEFLMNQDITYETGSRHGSCRRFGFGNSSMSVVTIRHVSSCLCVTVGENRLQYKNFEQARYELNKLLKVTFKLPSNMPPKANSELRLVVEYLPVVRSLIKNTMNVKLASEQTRNNIHIVQKVKGAMKKIPEKLMERLI